VVIVYQRRMDFSTVKKPTERSYTFNCHVVVKEVTYSDEQSTGTKLVTEKLVFLMPEQSTQRDLFYSAWLPDTDATPQEVGCEMGHPVFSTFRAALWRRSQFVGDIHLFVMSKGAEELLKPLEGRRLEVTVLGEQEDTRLDEQRDWELPYNKNKGSKVEAV
jgi:hypothetical protein